VRSLPALDCTEVQHNSAMKPEEMSLVLFRLPPIFEKTDIPASRTGIL
jgi:hypothetical protein